MLKNRGTKWTVLLLAVVMVFSLFSLTALAEEAENIAEAKTEFTGDLLQEAMLSTEKGFSISAAFVDQGGNQVADLAEADPNNAYQMQLSVGSIETALTEAGPEVLLVYPLENMTAVDGENADISWTYDQEGNRLVFQWKGEKKNAFVASVGVVPAYPETQGLDGKGFAIVANGNVLLSGVKGQGLLNATKAESDSEGKLWYAESEDAYWTFSHVTGDWYKISREGQYLNIGSGLTLTGDPETAQIIKVEPRGNYYLLHVNGRSISCVNATEGFKTAGVGATIVAKQQVILHSEISNEATNGLPERGSYIIANSKATYKNLLLDEPGKELANSLAAGQFTLEGDTVVPRGKYVLWQFERVTRNWYYISNGNGQYLMLLSNGAALTSEPTPLLVTRNGNGNQYSISGAGALSKSYLNNKSDSATKGFIITNDNRYKWLQLYSGVKADTTVPAGEWLITFPEKKALMMNEMKNGIIRSEAYQTIVGEDNLVSIAMGKEAPLWTFEKVQGNTYYVRSGEQYLNLDEAKATLSNQPQLLYVEENGGRYRINDGKAYGLATGNDASSGIKGAYDHNNKGIWFTLSEPYYNKLAYNVNGGNVAANMPAEKVEAGDVITVPNYTGTKNGKKFLGWAKVSNIYAKPAGKNHTYQEVYLPGQTLTVPEEGITLYAVYNEKTTTVQFGFRSDGTIPDEPGNYEVTSYEGHFVVENALKDGMWVVDIDGGKPITGNHVDNAVTASLNIIPSTAQIQAALPSFNPETQYVHWYVLKYTGSNPNPWHVDGVIRERNQISVTYHTNVDGEEKDLVTGMPLGFETAGETTIAAGEDKKGQIKEPSRAGYDFDGWNTEADGSGTSYNTLDAVTMDDSVNLYAQWVENDDDESMRIRITSDWPEGEKAYAGTKITMTATLFGFDDVDYVLQWQHTTDGNIWIDEPGANDITYTFTLDQQTSQYTWRVVAKNVRKKATE